MTDRTKTFRCPKCANDEELFYETLPRCRLHFESNGEEHTHHFGELRDYKCANCEHEWLQPDDWA